MKEEGIRRKRRGRQDRAIRGTLLKRGVDKARGRQGCPEKLALKERRGG